MLESPVGHRLAPMAFLLAVLAACSGGHGPGSYSIGGMVSGLSTGGSVVLQDNAANDLTVSANGTFTFPTKLRGGTAYAVTISKQSAWQTCAVTAGTGTVGGANVTGIRIACTPAAETVVHAFGATAAQAAAGVLVQGSDGSLYGTTRGAGTTGNGTVFKIDATGASAVFYSFAGGTADGAVPTALIQGSDGNLYGATTGGGAGNNGTVFKLTTAGVETVLYSFTGGSDGTSPYLLTQGSDGNLYGITGGGGANGQGIAFKITPTGSETVLHSFGTFDEGQSPASLIQGSDGNLYGTMSEGGGGAFCSHIGCGTVFKMTPAGDLTVLYTFNGNADGAGPTALIQGRDGNFYGTAAGGGNDQGDGVLFKLTPAGVKTALYVFEGFQDGSRPVGLIQGSDGNLYGVAAEGGTGTNCPNFGCGVLFSSGPGGGEIPLHSFAGGTADGSFPSGLTQGADGKLYGISTGGGTNANGTVFKAGLAGAESVLSSFPAGTDDAAQPNSLIQGSDGNFYGTAVGGAGGAAFKITPAGTETVLHTFTANTTDASNPTALIQGSDGNFYGVSGTGGPSDNGTVFKLTPAGAETVLHAFAGGSADGAGPMPSLIQATDGNFYGITNQGGTNNAGTVFKITPAGAESLLYAFAGGTSDGDGPSTLVQGSDGNFYGVTAVGGGSEEGTVFKLTPAGVESVLHSFAGGTADGSLPSGLTQGADGNLYGITQSGGANNHGTVFKITPAGVETILYSFTTGSDFCSLTQGTDGNLYGTLHSGGATGAGVLFEVTLSGAETDLISFSSSGNDGNGPRAVIQARDGALYGIADGGGLYGGGVLFKFQ